jgi:prevent-host-death family protein
MIAAPIARRASELMPNRLAAGEGKCYIRLVDTLVWSDHMFAEIGAYDAKTKLPELLREVQNGKRFTITHRGKPVADLVPTATASTRDIGRAIQDMLNFKRITNIDPDEVSAWIREGRQ